MTSFSTLAKTTTKALNWSFSGCGFLIPFHIGVVRELLPTGLLSPQKSKFAGASGGALIAVGLASGLQVNELREACDYVVSKCREHGTAWKLERAVYEITHQMLPQTSWQTINHEQNLCIAKTQLWPRPSITHTTTFKSREDLIEALLTSCYLPSYSMANPVRRFRDGWFIDGGIFEFVPLLDGYHQVAAFPEIPLRKKDDINPSLIGDALPYSAVELFRMSLRPPSLSTLDRIEELGRKSANAWLEEHHREPQHS